MLGVALIGTAASDELGSFADSRISDRILQLNVYGRTHLSERLRFAASAGWGRSWYEFKLQDGGLSLDGEAHGKRHLYGAALSGDIRFAGLDITHLSVPLHVPIVFDRPTDGREATRLDISPGVLCQDTAQDSSSIDCGNQLGLKFRLAPSIRSLIRAEAKTEAVDGYLLNSLTVGFQRRFGSADQLAMGVDVSPQGRPEQADNRVMVRVGFGR